MYIDNTTKKHPTEPHCGGVSRAWLVEQLPKAKHPNMLLEVALHPYFPCTFCDFAYVTEDVLVDVFMGEDTLTAREACGLLRGLSNFKYITFDYMIEEQLTICEDKKRIEKAKEIARGFSGRHPAHSLIQQQLEQPLVPLAAVHGAERFRRQKRTSVEKRMCRRYAEPSFDSKRWAKHEPHADTGHIQGDAYIRARGTRGGEIHMPGQ